MKNTNSLLLKTRERKLLFFRMNLDDALKFMKEECPWKHITEMIQDPDWSSDNDFYLDVELTAVGIIAFVDNILAILTTNPELNDDKFFIPYLHDLKKSQVEWLTV